MKTTDEAPNARLSRKTSGSTKTYVLTQLRELKEQVARARTEVEQGAPAGAEGRVADGRGVASIRTTPWRPRFANGTRDLFGRRERDRVIRMKGFALGVLLAAVFIVPTGAQAATAHTTAVNCSDFSSQAAAQNYFVAHGGPSSDPDGLDADHDGIACEDNPCPCSSSSGGGGGGGGGAHKHHRRRTTPKLSRGDAWYYADLQLSRDFNTWVPSIYFTLFCDNRISRTKVQCQVNWTSDDGVYNYQGPVTIWFHRISWFYAYHLTITNLPCAAAGGGASCVTYADVY
jgi:hypothetical protein